MPCAATCRTGSGEREMTSPIQIQEVITQRALRAFVKFPWRVYI
jgi:hypothetical protein